jgi:hypothetical protein
VPRCVVITNSSEPWLVSRPDGGAGAIASADLRRLKQVVEGHR